MMRILVTGAGGQLGQEIRALQPHYPQFSWLFASRSDLDLSLPGAIDRFMERHAITHCINCAAFTAVDLAETNFELASRVNTEAVRELARACNRQGALFIHLSSDYVYHNLVNRPLRETDPTTPQNVYAQTKLAGDLAAIEENPNTCILRASWIYSAFGHNFVKTMLRLGKTRPVLQVVDDQIGTPTYARDIAQAILELLEQEALAQHPGIYNFANEGVCSWYDFAKAIFQYSGLSCEVVPIPSIHYPTPASRPAYSVLDKRLFKETFHRTIPYWRDSLQDCMGVLGELSAQKFD